MRKDLTEIVLIVDRSGSMASCLGDAEGGVNTFIEEQKTAEGNAQLTLVQFDTEDEFLHIAKPIADVPRYKLKPRGMTALLDAVGRAVNEASERLGKLPDDDRPGCVIVVIVTDGHENASKEYKLTSIRELIERQQKQHEWKFIFLGADAAAFAEAGAMGISAQGTGQFAAENTAGAYAGISSSVSRMRGQAVRGETVCCSFTDDERTGMG